MRKSKIFRMGIVIVIGLFCLVNQSWAVNTDPGEINKDIQHSSIGHLLKLEIPSSWGIVKDSYNSGTDKLVVNIQDAHCDFEAQKNIANILNKLASNYKLKVIALEGASGKVENPILSNFPEKKVRENVSLYLVKQGKLTGAEYFAVNSDQDLKLYGVEDLRLYMDNLDAFQQSQPFKAEAKKYFSAIKNALDVLKQSIYNDDLKKLDILENDYALRRISFDKYAVELYKLVEESGLRKVNYPTFYELQNAIKLELDVDFKKADAERMELITTLTQIIDDKQTIAQLVSKSLSYKKGMISAGEFANFIKDLAFDRNLNMGAYPNFDAYSKYITKYEQVANAKLFQEIKAITKNLKKTFYTDNDQKQLDSLYADLDVLVKLVNLKMVNEDISYFFKNRDNINTQRFISFIEPQAYKHKAIISLPTGLSYIDMYIPAWAKFYELANTRDAAFIAKTLNHMDAENTDYAALITGGFHTKQLTRLLKEKKISYLVIAPKASANDSNPYFNIMQGGKSDIETFVTAMQSTLGVFRGADEGALAELSPAQQTTLKEMTSTEDQVTTLALAVETFGAIAADNPDATDTQIQEQVVAVFETMDQAGTTIDMEYIKPVIGRMSMQGESVVVKSSNADNSAMLVFNPQEPNIEDRITAVASIDGTQVLVSASEQQVAEDDIMMSSEGSGLQAEYTAGSVSLESILKSMPKISSSSVENIQTAFVVEAVADSLAMTGTVETKSLANKLRNETPGIFKGVLDLESKVEAVSINTVNTILSDKPIANATAKKAVMALNLKLGSADQAKAEGLIKKNLGDVETMTKELNAIDGVSVEPEQVTEAVTSGYIQANAQESDTAKDVSNEVVSQLGIIGSDNQQKSASIIQSNLGGELETMIQQLKEEVGVSLSPGQLSQALGVAVAKVNLQNVVSGMKVDNVVIDKLGLSDNQQEAKQVVLRNITDSGEIAKQLTAPSGTGSSISKSAVEEALNSAIMQSSVAPGSKAAEEVADVVMAQMNIPEGKYQEAAAIIQSNLGDVKEMTSQLRAEGIDIDETGVSQAVNTGLGKLELKNTVTGRRVAAVVVEKLGLTLTQEQQEKAETIVFGNITDSTVIAGQLSALINTEISPEAVVEAIGTGLLQDSVQSSDMATTVATVAARQLGMTGSQSIVAAKIIQRNLGDSENMTNELNDSNDLGLTVTGEQVTEAVNTGFVQAMAQNGENANQVSNVAANELGVPMGLMSAAEAIIRVNLGDVSSMTVALNGLAGVNNGEKLEDSDVSQAVNKGFLNVISKTGEGAQIVSKTAAAELSLTSDQQKTAQGIIQSNLGNVGTMTAELQDKGISVDEPVVGQALNKGFMQAMVQTGNTAKAAAKATTVQLDIPEEEQENVQNIIQSNLGDIKGMTAELESVGVSGSEASIGQALNKGFMQAMAQTGESAQVVSKAAAVQLNIPAGQQDKAQGIIQNNLGDIKEMTVQLKSEGVDVNESAVGQAVNKGFVQAMAQTGESAQVVSKVAAAQLNISAGQKKAAQGIIQSNLGDVKEMTAQLKSEGIDVAESAVGQAVNKGFVQAVAQMGDSAKIVSRTATLKLNIPEGQQEAAQGIIQSNLGDIKEMTVQLKSEGIDVAESEVTSALTSGFMQATIQLSDSAKVVSKTVSAELNISPDKQEKAELIIQSNLGDIGKMTAQLKSEGIDVDEANVAQAVTSGFIQATQVSSPRLKVAARAAAEEISAQYYFDASPESLDKARDVILDNLKDIQGMTNAVNNFFVAPAFASTISEKDMLKALNKALVNVAASETPVMSGMSSTQTLVVKQQESYISAQVKVNDIDAIQNKERSLNGVPKDKSFVLQGDDIDSKFLGVVENAGIVKKDVQSVSIVGGNYLESGALSVRIKPSIRDKGKVTITISPAKTEIQASEATAKLASVFQNVEKSPDMLNNKAMVLSSAVVSFQAKKLKTDIVEFQTTNVEATAKADNAPEIKEKNVIVIPMSMLGEPDFESSVENQIPVQIKGMASEDMWTRITEHNDVVIMHDIVGDNKTEVSEADFAKAMGISDKAVSFVGPLDVGEMQGEELGATGAVTPRATYQVLEKRGTNIKNICYITQKGSKNNKLADQLKNDTDIDATVTVTTYPEAKEGQIINVNVCFTEAVHAFIMGDKGTQLTQSQKDEYKFLVKSVLGDPELIMDVEENFDSFMSEQFSSTSKLTTTDIDKEYLTVYVAAATYA